MKPADCVTMIPAPGQYPPAEIKLEAAPQPTYKQTAAENEERPTAPPPAMPVTEEWQSPPIDDVEFPSDEPLSGSIEVTEEMLAAVDIDKIMQDDKSPEQSGEPAALSELPRETAYISDDMFKAAGGTTASTPPPPGTGSSVSMDELMRADILEKIKKRHHVTLIDDPPIPTQVLQSLKSLLLDGDPIADEDLVRQSLFVVLPAFDRVHYKRDKRMERERTSVLFRVLQRELRKRGEKELAAKLEPATTAGPPPLPPSKR